MVTQSPRNWYYGDAMSQSKHEGSGIIIDSKGYIMTNYHVVQYADPKNSNSKNTTLEVFLSDGNQAMAKFIGGDQRSDLAVIKIDMKDLPQVELGDSMLLRWRTRRSYWKPLGLNFRVRLQWSNQCSNRTISIDDRTMNLIQTDAAY